MTDLGVCPEEEIALSVLATVIGHRRDLGYLLVDAGGLALSKDAGPARPKPGYGSLWDAATGLPLGLAIASTNQEHGLVPAGDADFDRLSIGSWSGSPPTTLPDAAAHERYHVVEGGTEVHAVWPRCNGW